MTQEQILGINYQNFKNNKITNRTFPFSLIESLIENDYGHFNWEMIGFSFQKRPIKMLRIGEGSTKIMLWSQMHGDEPTATAAIFDLINYFQSTENQFLLDGLSIYFIPVINPDGLEIFTRRNAQQIDINRDYIALQSPEAKVLKTIKEKIKPDFAFNLHDQSTLYCTNKNIPVAISLLAPAADADLSITWCRTEAMKVITAINHSLQNLIPKKVARFKDEYEPRAFGDNFQKTCPTILIESGFLPHDSERQYIRELNFFALITAFDSIAKQSYQEIDIMNYLMIPLQSQDMLHVKITNCNIGVDEKAYAIDLGLNYTEIFDPLSRTMSKLYQLIEIGDLSTQKSHEVIEAKDFIYTGELNLNQNACIELRNHQSQIIFECKSGIRV